MKSSRLRLSVIVVGILLLLACGPGPLVRPAPGVSSAGSEARAVVGHSALIVEVETDAWRGSHPLTILLPLQLEIENASSEPLAFELSDISLEFEDGQVRRAQEAQEIEGEELVDETLYGHGTGLIDEYRFPENQTRPTPQRPLLGQGPEPGDPPPVMSGADREPDKGLLSISLPTAAMMDAALLGERLDPGERVSGFVYFPQIPADAEAADLVVRAGPRVVRVPLIFE